jgi:hypothetical protein
MTIYVGGARQRLIKENLVNFVEDGLTAIGWFNAGRNHEPVTVTGDHIDPSVSIRPNVVGVSFEDEDFSDMELGSDLEETRHSVVIDVFAENVPIGQHLKGDVTDLLRGKFTSISSTDRLAVWDLFAASPSILFHCQFEDFFVERNRQWETAHNEFWWSIAVDLVDHYANDLHN